MDERIKLEYLDRIKSTDQANKTQATHCIRETFDRYRNSVIISDYILSTCIYHPI